MIGIMIIPYVASVSEDAMRAVPMHMREGSYAMGATRLQTALRVVVPARALRHRRRLHPRHLARHRRDHGRRGRGRHAAEPHLEPDRAGAATITAYIVQVSLGDLPHGSLGYQSIFAAGLVLMLMTLVFNVIGHFLRRTLPGGLLRWPP